MKRDDCGRGTFSIARSSRQSWIAIHPFRRDDDSESPMSALAQGYLG